MKSFADELREISAKAQKKKEKEDMYSGMKDTKKGVQVRKQVTKKEMRGKAEKFLVDLKKRLKNIAKDPERFFYPVLKLKKGTEVETQLDYYEKLIFDGCKKMKLRTTITELFDQDMTSQWSIGYHIYVKWGDK